MFCLPFVPNSGITLNLPRTTFEAKVQNFSKEKDFPIDYPVTITVDDIIKNRDKYMMKLKSII